MIVLWVQFFENEKVCISFLSYILTKISIVTLLNCWKCQYCSKAFQWLTSEFCCRTFFFEWPKRVPKTPSMKRYKEACRNRDIQFVGQAVEDIKQSIGFESIVCSEIHDLILFKRSNWLLIFRVFLFRNYRSGFPHQSHQYAIRYEMGIINT
jgi:hypothetical protein